MADKGETTTVLEFDVVKTVMIWSPNGKGVLFERRRKSGNSRLVWTKYLTEDNKSGALIWVYSYKSIPPANGTYVVLEFADSGNFIFGCGNATKPKLCVGVPDGTDLPDDPEDITTPTDPRVFLMKGIGSGSDVIFVWKGSTDDVITMLPPPKNRPSGPCGLKPEGNGPVESQLFQLNLPLLRKADVDGASEAEMSDRLVVVPFPFPFLPPGLESEARQA